MNRRDVLTTCVVALGVAGIGWAVFSPQPACAKGPSEGSQPKVTVATAQYLGCTITLRTDATPPQLGQPYKLTLECQNPTDKMVDFTATLSWQESLIQNAISRVAMTPRTPRPTSGNLATARQVRCIAFPRSTAAVDLSMPANPSGLAGTRQLEVKIGTQTLLSPAVAMANRKVTQR